MLSLMQVLIKILIFIVGSLALIMFVVAPANIWIFLLCNRVFHLILGIALFLQLQWTIVINIDRKFLLMTTFMRILPVQADFDPIHFA